MAKKKSVTSETRLLRIDKSTPTISKEELAFLQRELINIREDALENPYVEETKRSLSAGAYRGAIGSYWNAVVDDLRQKVEHRSLDLFNKEMSFKKEIKTYEDFQNHVTDHDLIEGAYKIGVIGWEARKLLHQARETRNIFDGHPKSSTPNLIKVLNMISDCNRYVLSQDFMPAIIDIDGYLTTMASSSFSKNETAIQQAFSDLPEIYKSELMNKFYNTYIHESSSTELRANIEFCAPVLWSYMSKDQKVQIGKRFDKELANGDTVKIEKATELIILVNGLRYSSTATRRALFLPAIEKMEKSIGNWSDETSSVKYLRRLGTIIPDDLLGRYITALTLIYVGTKGYSLRYGRTDFYSDSAVSVVKGMFEKFDTSSTEEFILTIKGNERLHDRIKYPEKLKRLRDLANILLEIPGLNEDQEDFLNLLIDKTKYSEFSRALRS